MDECRVKGAPPEAAPPPPPLPADAAYRFHSLTVLPGVGPTVVGLMAPRRAGRRKQRAAVDEPEEPRLPEWMTPGVHTFHPEDENTLEWDDLVRGAEEVGGKVEGWIRQFGEGLRAGVPGVVGEVGGELIEMVSGVGAGASGRAGNSESASASSVGSGLGATRRRKGERRAAIGG